MTERHALIAGAGIGGLTAALCLARLGWRVTLLERAPVLEEVGAGLQLSPNASRILQELGVLGRLEGASLRPQAIRIRRGRDASVLSTLPLQDAETIWGAPYCLALRCDLQRALIEAVAQYQSIRLLTGMTVAGFATTGERLQVAAKQGLMTSTFEGDCLIGADGVRSFVRDRLFEDKPKPYFSGCEAWRTLVPIEHIPAELRAPETGLWLGHDAHVVHYPLRGGTVVNIAVILGKAHAPKAQETSWTTHGDLAYITQRFEKWHPLLRALIASSDEWLMWPLYELAPMAAWSSGPVALLGDAAHPMLPFLAQGAAQAIEDAQALASALQQGQSIATALTSYAAARRGKATKVQEASRQQGKIYHLGGAPALARNMAMRAMGAQRMLMRNDWIYRG